MNKFDKKIFDNYINTLLKWQKSINLVSPNSVNNLWDRHFLDSLSLYDLVKNKNSIYDIGSGAGFPGMVLSVYGIKNITCVESDERKCFFLKEIKRIYNTDTNIINDRIENINNNNINCIIGRAFAPLDNFLSLVNSIINKNTEMFLLKGLNINKEIDIAKNNWYFDYELFKKNNGYIVKIYNIYKK